MKFLAIAYTLLIALFTQSSAFASNVNEYSANAPMEMDWNQWDVVGEADLNFLFFDIYTSRLLSPTGQYQVGKDMTPHPVALQIRYERSISSKQLVDETVKQWLQQGVSQQLANQWRVTLDRLFPRVNKDDQLLFVTDGEIGEFYFAASREQFTSLGVIEDEAFNDAFLSIWLSPKTEFPKHRLALIGQ